MKVLKTNWINFLGVFVTVLGYSIIFNIIDNNVSRSLFQSVFAALILVALYGMMFWGLFAVALLVIDLILFSKSQSNLRLKLICEWLIISIPFIYWIISYKEWVFIVAVLTFLLTQLWRERLIRKVHE